jgi:hypothetical protein
MEKSPDQIVADIDRKQNEEDKDLIPRAGRMIKEKFMELMTSKPKDQESIRVDRSPKYSDSQMASTRKQIEERAKASKPELDKASEDYDKAIGKTKGKKAGGMIKSSASKRADGCAIRGKTRA